MRQRIRVLPPVCGIWQYLYGVAVALVGLLTVIAIPAIAAQPAPDQQPGDPRPVYRDHFDFGRKQIPLPEGEWQLAGRSYTTISALSGTGYGAIESAVLFQLDKNVVAGFIIVRRNVMPIQGGWGTAADCSRDDIYEAITFDESADRPFCGFISYIVTDVSDSSDGAWKAAVDTARRRSLTMPTTWLMVGYRLSDRNDMLDIRYHFNPELQGFAPAAGRTWADNSWSKSRLTGVDPNKTGLSAALVGWVPRAIWGDLTPQLPDRKRRLTTVVALSRWLQDMRFPVEEGFSNRLSGVETMPMPWASGKDQEAPPPEIDLRLALLDRLNAQHALPGDEFSRQRAIVMTQSQHVGGRVWSAEQLTAAKATTDQLTTIMTSFAADVLWTGNLATAGTILTISSVVDLSRYSTLEYMWNTYGPRRIEPTQKLDFASAGIGK